MSSWIKGLFSKKATEDERVVSMERRQMWLSERSAKLYEEIGKLEGEEKKLVDEGKASTSKVTRRRKAQQISLLRKDIRMRNTSAAILNKQINTIGVHLRNLELAQSNAAAGLPSCDELTEAAVNAEDIIESLSNNDDLVNSIENQMDHSLSAEETAILAEFEEEDGDEESEISPDSDAAAFSSLADMVKEETAATAEELKEEKKAII